MTTYAFADPPPYQHQLDCLNKIIATRGQTALLCEPGTGKSRVALDYAAMYATKHGAIDVLVVAPMAAVDTWLLQAELFIPESVNVWAEVLYGSIAKRADRLTDFHAKPAPRRDTVFHRGGGQVPNDLTEPCIRMAVVNKDTFSSRRADSSPGFRTVLDRVLNAVKEFAPDLIVWDEVHHLKGATSNVSRAAMRLRDLAPMRLGLTGTPTPHSYLDVYGQWRFIAPEVFADQLSNGNVRPWSQSGFKHRYAIMGGFLGREVIGFHRIDELQDKMAANAIVVRKADALDLPPTSPVIVPVHMDPAEIKAYRELKQALATRLDSGDLATVPNRLVQMLRLRQITSGHLPDDDGTIHEVGRSKVRTATSLVSDLLATEDRIVIFAYFRYEVAALADAIKVKGQPLMVEQITGDTPQHEREAIRARFGNVAEYPYKTVLVAQQRTLSLAVNELVTASHAIFCSLSERRDDLIQARDRLDRIGQTKPVTYHFLVAPSTVDEIILTSHQQRTDLEAALLDHIKDNA